MSPVEVFATGIKIFDRQMCAWSLDRPIKSSWLLDFSCSSEVTLIPWSALKKGLIQFDPDRKCFYTGHISAYPPSLVSVRVRARVRTRDREWVPFLFSIFKKWQTICLALLACCLSPGPIDVHRYHDITEPIWCKCDVMQLSPCTYTIRKMPGTQPKWKWKQMFNWKFVLEREDYRCA